MATERRPTPGTATVRAGGWSLILGAVAFMAVFSYLAARWPTGASRRRSSVDPQPPVKYDRPFLEG
jgi:hypothetical protein